MQKTLIIGATSAIAQAVARLCAARGDKLFLIARNSERLGLLSADLKSRGAVEVGSFELDVNDAGRCQAALHEAVEFLGQVDVALIAHGTLPDQTRCQESLDCTLEALNTNAVSTLSLMMLLANQMEQQRSGTLAVISSVAGDRGRQSNYVYGTAKAAVSTFAQGLRNRLQKSGVHVLTIKPGFVDTPMTAEFKKGLLWAKPDAVANSILHAIDKQTNVLYTPFFWRYIMLIIRLIPEGLFKKMSM